MFTHYVNKGLNFDIEDFNAMFSTYIENIKNLQMCLTLGTSPTKWRASSLRQTLQMRVTSDTQKIQSSDWPK